LHAFAALRVISDGIWWRQQGQSALKRMRWGFILLVFAALVGADPALAQRRAPDVAPYPTETTVKHRAPRTANKPQATSSWFHWNTQATTNKSAPVRQRAARPSVTKPPVVKPPAKQAEAKPAPIPLPTPAPRAKIASLAPTKPKSEKIKADVKKAAPAKAQPAKAEPKKSEPAKVAVATPEGKSETAKPDTDALAGISASDRLKIEQQLFWSGDFTGSVNGDDPMEAAIKRFQKRNKSKITGVLTSEQRAEIIAAADRHAQEFGWRVVVDPATGVRVGLPTKLVPDAHEAEHGTRWSSPHGAVQVETFRVKNAKLANIYEQERKKPHRNIERAKLDDDGFFISGMQGLKYFSVRAKARDGEVRGFTLLYDQMMEGIVAPVAVAMASAFSPFPERPLPLAALSKKVEYGTGLIVSREGHIVTARRMVQGCEVIVAGDLGNIDRIAEDPAHGLALLRVYGAAKLPALALGGDAPKKGNLPGDITLIGIPDPKDQGGGGKMLTEVKARLLNDLAIDLRQPVPMAGLSGAAALDGQGRFLGVMETRNFVLASADPSLPPVRLVTTKTIRDFLEQHHVAANGGNADARKAAVRIICVRK
jgi:hypothetical protein